MPDTYRITVTTKSGETHEGLMNRSQPELVNGFISVAREEGGWVYLAPGDVLKMEYVPEPVKSDDESMSSSPVVADEASGESE